MRVLTPAFLTFCIDCRRSFGFRRRIGQVDNQSTAKEKAGRFKTRSRGKVVRDWIRVGISPYYSLVATIRRPPGIQEKERGKVPSVATLHSSSQSSCTIGTVLLIISAVFLFLPPAIQHCNVPQTETSGLGNWVSHQRLQKSKNTMPTQREKWLTDLGLQWKLYNGSYWENSYNELARFQRENGVRISHLTLSSSSSKVKQPECQCNPNSLCIFFPLPRTRMYLLSTSSTALQCYTKAIVATGSLGQGSAQEKAAGDVTKVPGRKIVGPGDAI